MRKFTTLATALAVGATLAVPAYAAGDKIRSMKLLSRPQAAQPQEFQFTQLIAQEWRKLGLDVEVKIMPWKQMAGLVWYKRQEWDITGWQMVGRPERSDPDELIFNLHHSSTAPKGYNFIGYKNPELDKVLEAQRVETNIEKRQALIYKAQAIIDADQAALMLVHPKSTYAYNNTIWDTSSIVDQGGIGIKNTWTFIGAKPLGDKKDMILNSADDVQGINPLWISGGVDSWITELIWDRVLRIGPDGLPKPWLAKSYNWVDATTVEIDLRDDVKWHDGKPLTSADVKFSFEAAMGKEAPMYSPFVKNIAGIEVDSATKMRFKLKGPSAAFLTATLSKLNIIPMHVWGPVLKDLETKPDNAESHQEKAPVGSGPFKFTSWKLNEEIVLTANKDHFSKPKMNRWILRIIPNQEAAIGMLKSGALNFLSDYSGDPKVLVSAAKDAGNLEVVSTTDMGFRYVAFNHRRPPFNDVNFRRALSLAINRDLIVGAAFKGYAVKSNSVVSPALDFWHNPDVDTLKTGADMSKDILKKAGYSVVGGKLHYPDGVKETLAK